MKDNTCESCKYFVQHYVKHPKTYSKAGWGHCFYPKVKARQPETPACEQYKEGAGRDKTI